MTDGYKYDVQIGNHIRGSGQIPEESVSYWLELDSDSVSDKWIS